MPHINPDDIFKGSFHVKLKQHYPPDPHGFC